MDVVIALATQLKALNGKVDGLAPSSLSSMMRCDTCGWGHIMTDCPIVGGVTRMKQVDFVGEFIKTQR